jgi:hypothetical protein
MVDIHRNVELEVEEEKFEIEKGINPFKNANNEQKP